MIIILASASPRRAEILRNAGFAFETLAVEADETVLSNELVSDYVSRLARIKARMAADALAKSAEPRFIVGADTSVLAQGEILGKPVDALDATRMLQMLSGETHEVFTGLAVRRTLEGTESIDVETTRVTFLSLSEKDIEDYVATGEPFGKAGGYGIQGIGGRFISRIEGCYFNVMGLPVSKLWVMLRSMGWLETEEPKVVRRRNKRRPTGRRLN